MTAGGGIDIKVSRHILVRPIQAEYFMTKIPDGLNNRQDNLRIGARRNRLAPRPVIVCEVAVTGAGRQRN